ncbi:hypothetical protein ACFV0T_37455 [Streptomyces sp. NPDC059582]|uniref:hypothetical protein n=1 Tax=Streptomyces sp. NPDC059582 TaxID=3346875 RepID=UPI0036D05252
MTTTGSAVDDVLSPTNELLCALHLFTDGEWFWHTDLAHYVERYHVPRDDDLLDDARLQGWSPPELSEGELIAIQGAFFPEDEV